ncbi:MAG: hypothetical protein KC646_09135 [Candidatus Cloacimonetes bacterium]|nr:hypothetical protein [Candidatus Cloacimonadota bacterium]
MKLYFTCITVFFHLTFTYCNQSNEFGVVHHFGSPFVTKDMTKVKKDVERIQSLGFQFVREGIYWDNIGSKAYVDRLKSIVDLYKAHNIRLLGLLAYSNSKIARDKFSFIELSENYSQVPIEDVSFYIAFQFSKYFEKIIKEFPYIRYFEVLNEMNLTKYFTGGVDPIVTYISILKFCYPIAQKYNVKLLTGGLLLEGDYLRWLDQLIEQNQYYDGLSLHPYCYPKMLSQATFGGYSLQQIVQKIQKKSDIDVWITEVGWLHSPSKSINEKQDVLNEMVFEAVLSDTLKLTKNLGVEKTFIYAFEDDSYITDLGYKPFGLQLKTGKLK